MAFAVAIWAALNAQFIAFSAQTRISGIDCEGTSIRKGAVDAVLAWVGPAAGRTGEITAIADRIAKSGGTPLAVARDRQLLGVIHLKDIVKGGIRERFAALAEDGHPHRDDYRRQPAHGCRHRRGVRRR